MDPILTLQSQRALLSSTKDRDKPLSKKSTAGSGVSFSRLLEKAEHQVDIQNESQIGTYSDRNLDSIAFEQALDNVFLIGEELKKDHGLHKLADYKKAVRQFLGIVLQKAYKHTQIKGAVNPRTMLQREYSLIQVVDERLERLALAVLNEQSEILSILARVDEIRGLLVDYMR